MEISPSPSTPSNPPSPTPINPDSEFVQTPLSPPSPSLAIASSSSTSVPAPVMDPISGIPKKKTAGRNRNTSSEMIRQRNNRNSTFYKRRTRLFKIAGDLCTLCGSQIAIFGLSMAGKAFTFGPSAESVIQRYLHGPSSSSSPALPLVQSDSRTPTTYSVAQTADHDGSMKAGGSGLNRGQFWWEGSVDGMGLEELERFRKSLVLLKKNVDARAASIPAVSPSLPANTAGLSIGDVYGIMECEDPSVADLGPEQYQRYLEIYQSLEREVAAGATTVMPPGSTSFAP